MNGPLGSMYVSLYDGKGLADEWTLGVDVGPAIPGILHGQSAFKRRVSLAEDGVQPKKISKRQVLMPEIAARFGEMEMIGPGSPATKEVPARDLLLPAMLVSGQAQSD